MPIAGLMLHAEGGRDSSEPPLPPVQLMYRTPNFLHVCSQEPRMVLGCSAARTVCVCVNILCTCVFCRVFCINLKTVGLQKGADGDLGL